MASPGTIHIDLPTLEVHHHHHVGGPLLQSAVEILGGIMASIDDLRAATGQVAQAIGALGATVQSTVDRVSARLENLSGSEVSEADVQALRDDIAPLQAMSGQLSRLASDPTTDVPAGGGGLDNLGGGGTTAPPVEQPQPTAPATPVEQVTGQPQPEPAESEQA